MLASQEFIKESKGRLDARNKDGETPLMAAARNGHLDVVRFLVEAGAWCPWCHSTETESAVELASLSHNVARFLSEESPQKVRRVNGPDRH